ncbi:hypothetical protein Glove_242g144 [Diversispora epigaea]|uniref:Uncharacterized protein n=1 Tax=Diversispora epigaea TaxID=1348612 RepID=A0A397IGD0_9GLOM|nr:hypothetical protein Glove_242g144 [Diversispora epigaea]
MLLLSPKLCHQKLSYFPLNRLSRQFYFTTFSKSLNNNNLNKNYKNYNYKNLVNLKFYQNQNNNNSNNKPLIQIFSRVYMTTNNENIIKSTTSKRLPHRMLIYTGPLAKDMILYKRLALFFCFLGFLMAPTMYLYGKAPIAGIIAPISAIVPLLFINKISATYVSRLFINVPSEIWYNPKMRKTFDPKKIDPISVNPTLYMEIQNWSGHVKGQTVKLNELRDYKGLSSWVTWIRITENNNNGGVGRNTKFFVEKKQLRQDPFSKGLMEFIEKRSVD